MPFTRRARFTPCPHWLDEETVRLLGLQLRVLELEADRSRLLDEEERAIRSFPAGWDALELS